MNISSKISTDAAATQTASVVADEQPRGSKTVDLKDRCVDLLFKLVSMVSEVKESDEDEIYETAVEVASKMIVEVKKLSSENLDSEAHAAVEKELEKASSASKVLEDLISNRSLVTVIRQTFGGKDPNEDDFSEANQNTFAAIKCSVVTFLFHAIQKAGADSKLGEDLDQSTRLIAAELESLY